MSCSTNGTACAPPTWAPRWELVDSTICMPGGPGLGMGFSMPVGQPWGLVRDRARAPGRARGLPNPSHLARRCPSTGLSRSPFGIKPGSTMQPSRPSHARAAGCSRRTTARPSASSCGCARESRAAAARAATLNAESPCPIPLPCSTTTWSSRSSRSSRSAPPCTRARRRTIRHSSYATLPGLLRVQSTTSAIRPVISTSGCVRAPSLALPRTPRRAPSLRLLEPPRRL
jgi:hypothetical protein